MEQADPCGIASFDRITVFTLYFGRNPPANPSRHIIKH